MLKERLQVVGFGAQMEFRTTLFALQNIIDAAIMDSPLNNVGVSARAVLLEVGRIISSGITPNIGDLVNNRNLGSPVTVLKRLRELEDLGWIKIARSSTEHRIKEIFLSDTARVGFATAANSVERSIFQGIAITGTGKVAKA